MDENTLNDLLECSVCLERLDTSSKVLPCQHTFCRKCLEVIVASRNELRCPECRIVVITKIDDLPPNVLLMRILEGMKNAAAATKTQQQQQQLHCNTNKIQKDRKSLESQQNASEQNLQQRHKNTQQQQQAPQQQQQQQHQQKPTQQQLQQILPTAATQQPYIANQQQRPYIAVPHAIALFTYKSNEANDLNFNAGDIILLERKIDNNWYVGRINEKVGTFPSNYVRIIVGLPAAQCVALYDFKMGPQEEEGCLTFKKGAIIHVLRRIDDNWAEGRIATAIGIFPIAFVELNSIAKQLLDASLPRNTKARNVAETTVRTQQNNQATVASTPAIIDPTINSNYSNDLTTDSSTSSNNTSPIGSATSTTVSTSSTTTNSSSNSIASSPNHSQANTPQHRHSIGHQSVRLRGNELREKRHSLNALLMAGASTVNGSDGGPNLSLSVLQSNRHSAEILSTPNELASMPTNSSTTSSSSTTTTTSSSSSSSNINRNRSQPNLPCAYLALYSYKPSNSDELELIKGNLYIVTERCIDGWFKGKNNQDMTGVFPGNYVTPFINRDQQQLFLQSKYSQPNAATNSTTNTTTNNSSKAMSTVNVTTQNINQKQHHPPDLPPRHAGDNVLRTNISSVWTKPLSHTVEAFFNRHSSGGGVNMNKNQNNHNVKNTKEQQNNEQSQKQQQRPAPYNHVSNNNTNTFNPIRRISNIKSLSKFLPGSSNNSNLNNDNEHNATQQQQHEQHTTFMTSSNQANMPIHVRSGSCPSQLLQSLPIDLSVQKPQQISQTKIHKTTAATQQQQQQQQQIGIPLTNTANNSISYGSQRLRGAKERPTLQSARQSLDGTMTRNLFNNQNLQQHQPSSQQLIASTTVIKKCNQQPSMNSINSFQTNTINHRKSYSLDANSFIPAPIRTINNSNTANLIVRGGSSSQQQQQQQHQQLNINNTNLTTEANAAAAVGTEESLIMPATLPQTNSEITTAAIIASATTKSTQHIGRESRFRCIVPYPPNSPVELELQVGDIIFVHRKQKNGWYKGTHARTNKTGLFPASFVEPDIEL